MLDWLGDVTFPVSFCQPSGDVCYPTNLCVNCMLCMGLHQTYEVCNYCIVSFLNDILSLYFVRV